jgi:hypothetical protein
MIGIDDFLDALAPALALDALRAGGATPFAFDAAGNLHLELRFVEELDALCLSAPLGRLLLSSRTETRLRLLAANLMLAQLGEPHYAIDAHSGTVYLCHTAAAQREPLMLAGVRAFLASWQQSRDGLRAAALID